MDVLYIGDYKLHASEFQVGADTFKQFHSKVKDYEPLLKAMEGMDGVEPEFLDGPDTMTDFPRTLEGLQEYDALIVSDLSRGTLEPHFFDDAIPGPNLLRIIKEYVESGGALIYCGGWMTFQGYQGTGNWQGTVVEDVPPTELKPVFDDRVERPSGAEPTVTDDDHPLTADLGEAGLPTLYGYNEVAGLQGDSELLATVNGDPLLAAGEFGEGRTVVYTSDPGIKWGYGMVEWDDYDEFWHNTLEWATGEA
jgi:uncharacterized membrane protein